MHISVVLGVSFTVPGCMKLQKKGKTKVCALRRNSEVIAEMRQPPDWSKETKPLFENRGSSKYGRGGEEVILPWQAAPREYVSICPIGIGSSGTTAFLGEPEVHKAYLSLQRPSLAMPSPFASALDEHVFCDAVGQHCDKIYNMNNNSENNKLSVSDVAMVLLRAQEFIYTLQRATLFHRDCPSQMSSPEQSASGNKGQNRARTDIIFQECLAGATQNGCFSSALDLLAQICEKQDRQVICSSIEEVETCEKDTLAVAGFLYICAVRRLYGEIISRGQPFRVRCSSPAFATAISTQLHLPCYAPRYLFDAAAVPVVLCPGRTSKIVLQTSGEDGFDFEQAKAQENVATSGKGRLGTGSSMLLMPWEVNHIDVPGMSDEAIRCCLQNAGVATMSREPRLDLLLKLADLMDEVERRELLIEMSLTEGLSDLAEVLESGRSERGKIVHRMREAERRSDWEEAFRLQRMADGLKSRLADSTQEPGSYDPYLDQDPWYRPSRM